MQATTNQTEGPKNRTWLNILLAGILLILMMLTYKVCISEEYKFAGSFSVPDPKTGKSTEVKFEAEGKDVPFYQKQLSEREESFRQDISLLENLKRQTEKNTALERKIDSLIVLRRDDIQEAKSILVLFSSFKELSKQEKDQLIIRTTRFLSDLTNTDVNIKYADVIEDILDKERYDTLKENYDELLAENERLKQENQVLKDRIARLSADYKDQASRLAKMAESNEDLKRIIENQQVAIDKLQAQLERFSNTDPEKYAEEIKKLREAIAKGETEMGELLAANEALKKETEKNTRVSIDETWFGAPEAASFQKDDAVNLKQVDKLKLRFKLRGEPKYSGPPTQKLRIVFQFPLESKTAQDQVIRDVDVAVGSFKEITVDTPPDKSKGVYSAQIFLLSFSDRIPIETLYLGARKKRDKPMEWH